MRFATPVNLRGGTSEETGTVAIGTSAEDQRWVVTL